jgi:hypothetical protein
VTRHERSRRNLHAEAGFQRARSSKAHCHQGRLGIGGQGQFLDRPAPDQRRQLLAQRRIHLVKHGLGGRKRVRQFLAHADRLRALAGENEGDARHTGLESGLNPLESGVHLGFVRSVFLETGASGRKGQPICPVERLITCPFAVLAALRKERRS